jgi:hypothetical protein
MPLSHTEIAGLSSGFYRVDLEKLIQWLEERAA